MNNCTRTFLFRYYWLITILVVVGTIPLIVAFSKPDNVPGNVATLFGAALGVVYFVQKQKLEELKEFESLFTRFNERYSEMNDDLQNILAGIPLIGTNVRDVLNNYFNLCAEEYLFYSQGLILPNVWSAWCRGMLVYLRNGEILQHWNGEVEIDSHYGLTIEIIQIGAACRWWP
jgi:hypothetical protein